MIQKNFSSKSQSTNTNASFYSDERLSGIDPERLSMLMTYAKELADAPQNQKISVFLSIQRKASQNQIAFTEAERDLLLQSLTEHMSDEEKKRVELIRTLAAKFGT